MPQPDDLPTGTLDDAVRTALRLADTRDVRIRFEIDVRGASGTAPAPETSPVAADHRVALDLPTSFSAESGAKTVVLGVQSPEDLVFVMLSAHGVTLPFTGGPQNWSREVDTDESGILIFSIQAKGTFAGIACTFTLALKSAPGTPVKSEVRTTDTANFIATYTDLVDFS
jgi:hypothetical protein